eukprot:gene7843-biopygen5268
MDSVPLLTKVMEMLQSMREQQWAMQEQQWAAQDDQRAFQAEVARRLDSMSATVTALERFTGAAEATKELAYVANNGLRELPSGAAVNALLDRGADPCGRLCRGVGRRLGALRCTHWWPAAPWRR